MLAAENPGAMYVSTNFGNGFALIRSAPTIATYTNVSITDNGYAYATAGSNIYSSLNYGQTWNNITSQPAYTSANVSASGQYMITCISGGAVYVSSNSGATFMTAGAPTGLAYSSVTVSSSGQYMVATALNQGVYTSTKY
jgi:photosystem II stability/assembly factor-like uncharacterized protein